MATSYTTCTNCRTQNPGTFQNCTNCGAFMGVGAPMQQSPQMQSKPVGADKKIAAGLCGILLGGLGIHKFILGYQQEGIILLSVYLISFIIAIVTCGIGIPLILIPTVIGIVEGVIYLTKSDEEFVQTYVIGKKPWF